MAKHKLYSPKTLEDALISIEVLAREIRELRAKVDELRDYQIFANEVEKIIRKRSKR